MAKKRLILLAVLLVAVVGAVAWVFLTPPEPVYEGKTALAWAEQCRTAGFDEGMRSAFRHLELIPK